MFKYSFLIISFIGITTIAYGIKPLKEYPKKPENYGLIYKEYSIKTLDGYSIKSWFFPSQSTVPIDTIKVYFSSPNIKKYNLQDSIPKPTVVICDGDAANMTYNIWYVDKYTSQGYNVVLFDWRGFGESSDFTINEDFLFYSEFLIDYKTVINFVNSLPEVEKNNIGLFGYSTGAYFSFAAAYKNPSVKCVIGRGLITSFDEVLPLLNEIDSNKDRKHLLPSEYPPELCPSNIAGDYDKPTMLIVGKEDNRTPVYMSKKIYKSLKQEKKLLIVKGAGHGGSRSPEVISPQLFFKHTVKFYDKHLKAEKGK